MDRLKQAAARRLGLPIEQIRYYNELTPAQLAEVDRWCGIKPPRENYLYAAKRDGGLVWDRVRIAELAG